MEYCVRAHFISISWLLLHNWMQKYFSEDLSFLKFDRCQRTPQTNKKYVWDISEFVIKLETTKKSNSGYIL